MYQVEQNTSKNRIVTIPLCALYNNWTRVSEFIEKTILLTSFYACLINWDNWTYTTKFSTGNAIYRACKFVITKAIMFKFMKFTNNNNSIAFDINALGKTFENWKNLDNFHPKRKEMITT